MLTEHYIEAHRQSIRPHSKSSCFLLKRSAAIGRIPQVGIVRNNRGRSEAQLRDWRPVIHVNFIRRRIHREESAVLGVTAARLTSGFLTRREFLLPTIWGALLVPGTSSLGYRIDSHKVMAHMSLTYGRSSKRSPIRRSRESRVDHTNRIGLWSTLKVKDAEDRSQTDANRPKSFFRL